MNSLKLELEALKLLKQEYKAAVDSQVSVLILMEIKLRLETIKDLCLADMSEELNDEKKAA